MEIYKDPEKRQDYYYDKALLFLTVYGGENLRSFCARERISYVKMVDFLGWQTEESGKRSKKQILGLQLVAWRNDGNYG